MKGRREGGGGSIYVRNVGLGTMIFNNIMDMLIFVSHFVFIFFSYE